MAARVKPGDTRVDFRAPKGLTRRAGVLWEKLVPAQVATPERLVLLRVALEALGRYDAAREIIRREGMTTCSKRGHMTHAHPMLAIERAARREFTRIWFRLRLHAEWIDWQAPVARAILGASRGPENKS